MSYEEPREQVAWNIAADQAKHVIELLKKATQHYLRGHLGKWYWNLTAVREMINPDLKPGERTDLDKIEKNTNKWGALWERLQRHEQTNAINSRGYRKSKAGYSRNIRIYQRKIMDFLKALGYLPSKEDRTKMTF